MANERHQEHGSQEALQGPDEKVHGKKEMAGNERVSLDWNVAPHICLFQAILIPTCPSLTPKMLKSFWNSLGPKLSFYALGLEWAMSPFRPPGNPGQCDLFKGSVMHLHSSVMMGEGTWPTTGPCPLERVCVTSCVSLGKWLNLAVPLFSRLSSGNNTNVTALL